MTACWVPASPSAHSVETDFITVNVRSNPAIVGPVSLPSSTRVIASIAASRACGSISDGSARTWAATRSPGAVIGRYGRPNGTPVTGSRPRAYNRAIASSTTTVPTAIPIGSGSFRDSPRRSRPRPSQRPGGLPDSV